MGQNQRYRAPPILAHFSGDWAVHWGYDLDFDPWPFGQGEDCVFWPGAQFEASRGPAAHRGSPPSSCAPETASAAASSSTPSGMLSKIGFTPGCFVSVSVCMCVCVCFVSCSMGSSKPFGLALKRNTSTLGEARRRSSCWKATSQGPSPSLSHPRIWCKPHPQKFCVAQCCISTFWFLLP